MDTLLPTQMFPRLPACTTFVVDTNFVSGTQKMFLIFSEAFCVRNKCFPVCAAQETSWATMCPQQCILVYQGFRASTDPRLLKIRHSHWFVAVVIQNLIPLQL